MREFCTVRIRTAVNLVIGDGRRLDGAPRADEECLFQFHDGSLFIVVFERFVSVARTALVLRARLAAREHEMTFFADVANVRIRFTSHCEVTR